MCGEHYNQTEQTNMQYLIIENKIHKGENIGVTKILIFIAHMKPQITWTQLGTRGPFY